MTAGGEIRKLEEPFFVMATQNPLEQEGTYPLPEAQLDRFFFKLIVQYSGRDELQAILDRTTTGHKVDDQPRPRRRSDHARTRNWSSAWSSPRTCRTTPSAACWPRTRRGSSRSRW